MLGRAAQNLAATGIAHCGAGTCLSTKSSVEEELFPHALPFLFLLFILPHQLYYRHTHLHNMPCYMQLLHHLSCKLCLAVFQG